MTHRMRRTIAWAFAAASGLLAIPTVVLLVLGSSARTPPDEFGQTGLGGLTFLAAFVLFAAVGALIVARGTGNAIGLVLCAIGSIGTIGTFAYQYADYTIYVSPGALPAGAIFAWLQGLGPPSAFGLLGLALLLFPDGRLPSRRWWLASWVPVGGIAGLSLGSTLSPGPIEFPFEAVRNPLGVEGLRTASEIAGMAGWLLMAGGVVLGGIAVVVRFRRSTGVMRQQLKWIALAGAFAGVLFVANTASHFLTLTNIDELRILAAGIAFAGFPLAAGVAILRYRLYDIDVVINRTLVYGALTAILIGAYVGGVLVLQLVLSPLTERNDLAVAGSTLAVAALFGPARARIQALVDRRFYRRRYDAGLTLAGFGSRLREQLDLEALTADLRDVVRETVQPSHVSVWMSPTQVRP